MNTGTIPDENVIASIKIIDSMVRTEKERHKKALEKLDKDRRDIQAMCAHLKWRYVPDASGNNDDWDYCETCGLEK